MTGEMKERYGRDKNNLHRSEMPFYKGDSSDDGRDGDQIVWKKKNHQPAIARELLIHVVDQVGLEPTTSRL